MKHETQKAKTTVKTETGKVGWGGGKQTCKRDGCRDADENEYVKGVDDAWVIWRIR